MHMLCLLVVFSCHLEVSINVSDLLFLWIHYYAIIWFCLASIVAYKYVPSWVGWTSLDDSGLVICGELHVVAHVPSS